MQLESRLMHLMMDVMCMLEFCVTNVRQQYPPGPYCSPLTDDDGECESLLDMSWQPHTIEGDPSTPMDERSNPEASLFHSMGRHLHVVCGGHHCLHFRR